MKHFLVFLFFQVFFYGLGYAQNIPQPDPGLKQQITFTVSEQTFYKLAAGTPFSAVSPVDMVLLQPHTVLQQVERRIAEDGHYGASISLLNAEEVWADWPTKVARYEINREGVQIYKTNGSLYSSVPKTAEEEQQYADMQVLLASESAPLQATTFPSVPTSSEIAQIQANGGTFQYQSDGSWEVRSGQVMSRFEPGTQKIIRSDLEGEYVVRQETTQYTTNSDGALVPALETVELPVIRPSGACMEKVTIRRYGEYKIAQTRRRGERDSPYSASGSTGLQLVPNPATEAITLQWGSSLARSGHLHVCDLSGKVLMQTTLEVGALTHRIELGSYPPGLYFLHVRTDQGYEVLKFVKEP